MFVVEAIIAGIVGYVFASILIDDDMILGWYSRFLRKLRYERRVIPDWIYKPLGGCCICFTGQLAVWYYLFTRISEYSAVDHVAFVCIAILTSHILITKFTNAE